MGGLAAKRLWSVPVAVALVAGSLFAGVEGAAPSAAQSVTPSKFGTPLSPRLQELSRPSVFSLPDASQADALDLAAQGPGSLVRADDERLLVTARLASVGSSSLQAVEATGAVITFVDNNLRSVTMTIAPADLPALAAVPGVEYVHEELAPMVNATCPTGIVSEGDAQLNAATARSTFGVDGSGVTVGVLSDSYNSLGGAPTDVSQAELPGTTNPCGHTTPVSVVQDSGNTDEGRAMAQIVHDLAPGASLAFATANPTEAAFATNITALKNGGAKVIVDDITYFSEPMYQDGVIAQAVNDARAAGVSYFSSAANSNAIVSGQNVGSYEALAYRPAACPASVTAFEVGIDDCHDFDPGPGVDVTDGFTFGSGSTLRLVFGWNEPQFGIGTDFDVFLLNSSDAVVAASTEDNLTSQRAFETIGGTATGQFRVVIGRFAGSGTPRVKFGLMGPDLTQAEWLPSATSDVIGPTIFGHNAALAASTVAAVPFNNSNIAEPYSSRGPATYCWGPVVGTTAAAPLPSCQSKQVDIAATDGGQTSFFGGPGPTFRFFGTSAAAPHAAAVAALQLQLAPGITPAQVKASQAASARAVGAFGPDAVGAGLLDAVVAVGARGAGAQSISWATPPPASVGTGTSFPVAATATSGLPVAIAASGQCTGGGTGSATITATGAGSCTVRADQSGAAGQWLPAPQLAAVVQVMAVGYVPTSPARLLDSRPGAATVDGVGGGLGVRPAGSTTALQVTGRAGVPADAGAAVLNVTVTEPEGPGFVTVWPCGEPQPLASNLNFTAGANVPNNVIVKIGAGGTVCLFTLANTHLIADLNGFFPAGASYTPTSPVRLLDTRPGSATGGASGVRPAGSTTALQVTGRAGVPADAGAAVLNVTVTEPEGPGFVTVWPCGEPQPLASNLNFTAGANVPNNVIVKIGAGGTVCLFTLANTHLIADLNGFFPAGSTYTPTSPARLLDSRPGAVTVDGVGGGLGVRPAATTTALQVTGRAGVPADAGAAVLNVTVTEPAGPGFVTVWPCGEPQPVASNLNFTAGANIPNNVIVKIGAGGTVCLFTLTATHLIADLNGFFPAS